MGLRTSSSWERYELTCVRCNVLVDGRVYSEWVRQRKKCQIGQVEGNSSADEGRTQKRKDSKILGVKALCQREGKMT